MIRRNTIQRELVLNAVRNFSEHVTAEEVFMKIREEHPHIGKGTVYRNLHILAEEGMLREIEIPGDPTRYDSICTEHYHVKCVECGHLFDVDMEPIEGVEKMIRDTHGMQFLDYEILFRGICPACRERMQKGE